MELLAKNIAYLIGQSKKTGKQIAHDIGKNQSTLSNWAGGYAKPGLDDFVAIAKYFNLSADVLLFKDLSKEESQVAEPAAEYKNTAHLELLIESYEIRIKQEQERNEAQTRSYNILKENFESLQAALKAEYIKPKKEVSQKK